MIRDQEKAEVSRAEGLLEQLEQKIDDLQKREAELEQLPHTDDHIHFLQVKEKTAVISKNASNLSVECPYVGSMCFTQSCLFNVACKLI